MKKILLISITLVIYATVFAQQAQLPAEQIALQYFADSIFAKDFPQKQKVRFQKTIEDESPVFIKMCFDDYLALLTDSGGSVKRAIDSVESLPSHLAVELQSDNKNFCAVEKNEKKFSNKSFYLLVRKKGALKANHVFVQLILSLPNGFNHYYIEINALNRVTRWCRASEGH